jgi:hypothetical protein
MESRFRSSNIEIPFLSLLQQALVVAAFGQTVGIDDLDGLGELQKQAGQKGMELKEFRTTAYVK